MSKKGKKYLEIKIDKLTNSIINRISGDCFPTDVHHLSKLDLKNLTKKKGWLFNWNYEYNQKDRETFKLTIRDNPEIIQGIISISDLKDHFYINLIENAPFNRGKNKLYEGVPGNLFAYSCKNSLDKGYQGFVSFTAKTKLIEHYENTLGAIHIGGHKMIIFPNESLKLIKKYFPN